uniref:nucleotidyl transferase AbiEii/AbiGii toxin family protein n=1 Tax=Candidatus Onthocola sp. TaxID=3085646 RepID=UPI003FEEC556
MNKDSLKAKAKNVAQKYNLDSRYIIQYVMFESLIRRISISKYKENIIIKGGFLLSSIFGFNQRSTMDMDATLKGMNLNKENVLNIIKDIIAIDINDGVRYEIFSIKDIRLEKKYPGFKIHLLAYLEDLRTHLMIDITTGDVITLKEIDYEYNAIFDNETINIMSYNIETIIAEKFEAIISRNVINSRMKDYYDLYMFTTLKWDNVNKNLLKIAINNTCNNRKTTNYLNDSSNYINLISKNGDLKKLWKEYQNKNVYAKNINFEDTILAISKINELLKSD